MCLKLKNRIIVMLKSAGKSFLFLIVNLFSIFPIETVCICFIRLADFMRSAWLGRKLRNAGWPLSFKKGFYLLGGSYINIARGTSFAKNCVLTAWDNYQGVKFTPSIQIGHNCHFGEYNHITSINEITIGDNLLTGRWVTISDNSHGQTDFVSLQLPPVERKLYSKGAVHIGCNVWIGDKATILPGVSIGDGAVIGANTVVSKDVPAYCIAVGNPMRIL